MFAEHFLTLLLCVQFSILNCAPDVCMQLYYKNQCDRGQLILNNRLFEQDVLQNVVRGCQQVLVKPFLVFYRLRPARCVARMFSSNFDAYVA